MTRERTDSREISARPPSRSPGARAACRQQQQQSRPMQQHYFQNAAPHTHTCFQQSTSKKMFRGSLQLRIKMDCRPCSPKPQLRHPHAGTHAHGQHYILSPMCQPHCRLPAHAADNTPQPMTPPPPPWPPHTRAAEPTTVSLSLMAITVKRGVDLKKFLSWVCALIF
jgi:hypothetical protein